jgi:hypothetical protein
VIVYTGPGHAGVAVDVAVTRNCTVPVALVLGLVNTCAILLPAPADPPVIAPVIVPIVHVNVLAADDVNEIFVISPLHIAAVFGVVTSGVGLTVAVIV